MRDYSAIFILLIAILGCQPKESSHAYTKVAIDPIFEDSVSIRAIEFLDDQTLAFAGSNGVYGTIDLQTERIRTNVQRYDSIVPEFRAVGHTRSDFFMLSVADPALLYKTGDKGKMQLVYKEEGEGVFYDALTFWNDLEGIAVGDWVKGCLSVLVTRDGGQTWQKVPCSNLPQFEEGIGAYAASNTNIAIQGTKAWIITSNEQLLYTEDKGSTWKATKLPISITSEYLGMYSLDFYNELVGYGIGGDFSKPELNRSNKIKTIDGGVTWQLVAEGQYPGYKSCVQYVPKSGGSDLVALGYTGITYSKDGGSSWSQLSEEGFYTLRFLNDSVAFAAGRNRIAKLVFQ